jgi:hypothetical protein
MSSDMLLVTLPGLSCDRASPKCRKLGRIAMKVINQYGDGAMWVFRVP